MDETLAKLEAEYCPPLDGALVSAILSDYDLQDGKNVEDARQILESLKEDALVEEQAGFDPSGTGAGEGEAALEKRSTSRPATSASLSRETEDTSLSNGLSSLGLEDGLSDVEDDEHLFDEPEGFEDLDEDAKVRRLQSVLGDQVNQYTIRHALRKCKGNWDHAVEDLLTQAYLADGAGTEDGLAVKSKGIEGFSEENLHRRGRKGKAKNRRLKTLETRSSSSPGLADEQLPHSPNRWTSASGDINFVTTRTGISHATVCSAYSAAAGSLSRTIAALLKESLTNVKDIDADDAAIEIEARYLGEEFPTITSEYRSAIVRLAYPSSTAAHELATALTAKSNASKNGGIQIIPRYAPPLAIDDDSDMSTITRKANSATTSRSPSIDGATASVRGEAYRAARAEAFAKATAAHRKAKSDRLMGGAAAYYGQMGREYSALSSNATAQAADALADSQSTATQLDLHGVDVLNGIRIAQERVEEWWEGLGESRVNGRVGAGDRQAGYRIVVGLGRHSEGGKGKLGPAVSKKLREEGWRVEAAGAVLIIKGPSR